MSFEKAKLMFMEGEGNRDLVRSQEKIRRHLRLFFTNNFSQRKLQVLFDELPTAKDKLSFAAIIAPYVIAKVNDGSDMDKLSQTQVNEVYERIMKSNKAANENR
ncbi:MAG: hypothetical protein ABI113_03600 [Mucilaginibacter sp.]